MCFGIPLRLGNPALRSGQRARTWITVTKSIVSVNSLCRTCLKSSGLTTSTSLSFPTSNSRTIRRVNTSKPHSRAGWRKRCWCSIPRNKAQGFLQARSWFNRLSRLTQLLREARTPSRRQQRAQTLCSARQIKRVNPTNCSQVQSFWRKTSSPAKAAISRFKRSISLRSITFSRPLDWGLALT